MKTGGLMTIPYWFTMGLVQTKIPAFYTGFMIREELS
jgi:hypothetical protein